MIILYPTTENKPRHYQQQHEIQALTREPAVQVSPKVPPSLLPPGPGLLLSGCGTVKTRRPPCSLLRAGLRQGSDCPAGCSGRAGSASAGLLLHKEACVAVSVQFKDLPETLLGCCHSFFWTFACKTQTTVSDNEKRPPEEARKSRERSARHREPPRALPSAAPRGSPASRLTGVLPRPQSPVHPAVRVPRRVPEVPSNRAHREQTCLQAGQLPFVAWLLMGGGFDAGLLVG